MDTTGNRVLLLRSGEPFFSELFACIGRATQFIHIQVYILGDDLTGRQLVDLLKQAISRGVGVFLMVDDFGSSDLSVAFENEIRQSGICFKRFSRKFNYKKIRIGRRQHAKLVVIDNEVAFIGGINFADRYSGFDGKQEWLDFAVKIEGAAAGVANRKAMAYWNRRTKKWLRKHALPSHPAGVLPVNIPVNDWLRGQLEISVSYKAHLDHAKKSICLVAAYFFPPVRILNVLKQAAERGVDVKIILTRDSDVLFIKAAQEYLYDGLQKAGIQLFEWDASILHAKVAVVDDHWVSIGSYNLNRLSDLGSLEMNAEIESKEFAGEVLAMLENEVISRSKMLQIGKSKYSSVLGKIYMVISYWLVRASLRLLFLVNKRYPRVNNYVIDLE